MIQKVKLTTHSGKIVEGKRIAVSSVFDSEVEVIWEKIRNVETLRRICSPKAGFVACGDAPLKWEVGEIFLFKLFLYKLIPIGRHTIKIITMDSVSGEINSQEFNDTVTIWNHYIKMENIGGGQVKYTDTVDLFAGKLTTLIALWSLRFYKHRQHKWIKILSEKNNHK